MSQPHITKCEDGSILLEWILGTDARFYISIEPNLGESSWGYVTKMSTVCDDLPAAFFDAITPTITDDRQERTDR